MTSEAATRLLETRGIHARPLRRAIGLLATAPRTVDELVGATALPRRSVEELLTALAADLQTRGDTYRLPSAPPGARTDPPPAPDDGALVAEMEAAIAAAPPPDPSLDHVPATADTVVRRARWLDETYELRGARVLFLGDHDLTSLALGAVAPASERAAVDVDERTLSHLDRPGGPRTLFADLRLGLPPSLHAWADVVVTDPPYTVPGVTVFLAAAAESLRDPDGGRVVLSYGYSDRHPTLGLKVQRAIQAMGWVFEAILPGFNRYRGAQAVGGASDLYVLRPTSRTRRAVASGAIYTRGAHAEESHADVPADLARLLARPTAPADHVTLDLAADRGPWLLRALLAANAQRASILVPNAHPDVAGAAGQQALRRLLAPKYALRFRRSHPGDDTAVVEAEAADPAAQTEGERLARRMLERAHGTVGNTWREGLIELDPGMTKNQARTLIAERTAGAGDDDVLRMRLLDVPRHRLAPLLAQVNGSTS